MDSYICPRCSYQTEHKNTMRRHLYRTRPCKNNKKLELTNEIREITLRDKIYHIPREDKSKSQTVNNFNFLSKFVLKMDYTDKMSHLLRNEHKKLLCFEDQLDDHFENRNSRLINDKYPDGYFLTEDDIIRLVDQVTKIEPTKYEEFNVYHKKTIKRIKLYSGTTWSEYIEDDGVKEIVSLIKSYFLDNYEQYLIKHLHGDNLRNLNRFKLLKHLEIYYRFISLFDLRPSICDLTDRELLGHRLVEGNDSFLAEKYMSIFLNIRAKQSDFNRVKKKILSIIINNTVHNELEINNAILDMLKLGEDYRLDFLSKHDNQMMLN